MTDSNDYGHMGEDYYIVVLYYKNRTKNKQVVASMVTDNEANKILINKESNSETCESIFGKRETENYGPWFMMKFPL